MSKHIDHIKEAKQNLSDTALHTKLIYSPFFQKETGNFVYIKPENLQMTGSFKIRGAYNKISKLAASKDIKGIVAASAGNHAQGVAYACRELGVPAIIVMPSITPVIKINATKSLGSQVVLRGEFYHDSYNHAQELAEDKGYDLIHPFDDMDIIYGQGTVGLEIMEELPDADIITVPVGGGGLISGILLAAKSINPSVRVIGVEPKGAMSMQESLAAGEVISCGEICTSAEGVAVKTPGKLTFDIVKQHADSIITVDEQDINEAVLILLERHKIVAEAAGALSLAALKYLDCKDKKIVCVVSGGNIDVVTISSVINSGLISRGRIMCFAVDLPDKPGQLLKVSRILAAQKANVIKLDHNQFKSNDRYNSVRLEITVETSGKDHIAQVKNAFKSEGLTLHSIY